MSNTPTADYQLRIDIIAMMSHSLSAWLFRLGKEQGQISTLIHRSLPIGKQRNKKHPAEYKFKEKRK